MYMRLAGFRGLGGTEVWAGPPKSAGTTGSFGSMSMSVMAPFETFATKNNGKITSVPVSVAEGYSFVQDYNGRWYPIEGSSVLRMQAGPSLSIEEMQSVGQIRTWDGKLVALITGPNIPVPGSPSSRWVVGEPNNWFTTSGYSGTPVVSDGIPGKGYWTQIFGAGNAKVRIASGLQAASDAGGFYLVASPPPGFASGGGRASPSMTTDQIKDKAILRTYDGRIGLILSYESPPPVATPSSVTPTPAAPEPIKTEVQGSPTPLTTNAAQGTPTPLEPSVKVVYVEPPKPEPVKVPETQVTPEVVNVSKEIVLDSNKKLIIGFSLAGIILLALIYRIS